MKYPYFRRVLGHIASSFEKDSCTPITLIHGVFGSGKSFLLSVLIIFLHRILSIKESFRILISSGTNVAGNLVGRNVLVSPKKKANLFVSPYYMHMRVHVSYFSISVDRILVNLLELGFTKIARVGSIKKIAKSVLPYTVQLRPDNSEGNH